MAAAGSRISEPSTVTHTETPGYSSGICRMMPLGFRRDFLVAEDFCETAEVFGSDDVL